MSKLSVIIPARNELYLKQTVEDLLLKSGGDTEIIVVLDGYWPFETLPEDKRVIIIHRERRGMRAAINSAVSVARGEYIMKVDAHCLFAEGFDIALMENCDDDWIVVPRRYSLEPDTWSVRMGRPVVDYEYLGWPYHERQIHGSKTGIHAWVWDHRAAQRVNKLLDENMTFQGSCWFLPRKYFYRLGELQEEGYGTFIGEAQELGLKSWLGGGKVITNKKTWYSHLWKGKPYREKFLETFGVPYTRIGHGELVAGNAYSVNYWMNNKWEGRIHDLSWLIERFWPVPSWPEDKNKWILSTP